MTFDEAVALIAGARTGEELTAVASYRRLVKMVHPDVAPAGRGAEAAAAFARLTALHTGGGVLTTRRHRWTLGPRLAAGDIVDLYPVADGGTAGVLKLPRAAADSDLLRREADALTRLRRDGDPRHRAYAPELIETFTHEDPATGERRSVTVLERLDGFVSLAEVAARTPGGVDPRDAAWMWRRLLAGLGWAHRAGVVHGAVLPEHVLIHPQRHGVVLVDWCYSARPGEPLPALVARHREHYPPEVPARRPATAATDIHLATGTLRRLIGPRLPERLRRFADGCTLAAPRMRPQDAWALLAELDEVLHTEYGPRRFRPYAVPA
ncbi:lipopolysaccharide kinase InaA family protein [Spirilliplanes yamanashiensis]|uniref:Protein kinase domain-containing protein n=1 Tax=Spirilliplanes yamanashiensis TaxID=42233 RepID=A0A8J3YCL3_9ACTN|nr:lipopolysaccharide kinase InaA family protein [Spirilliplanes yamanashiensis]MDP9818952.1 serine/threonine protein kinase [Spirilliplanes yamanashiensis]GIJ05407.1 hypothetical protein Sya03_47590 [Spirilliplanes yamanashiensis]